jgi:hypothetical protein
MSLGDLKRAKELPGPNAANEGESSSESEEETSSESEDEVSSYSDDLTSISGDSDESEDQPDPDKTLVDASDQVHSLAKLRNSTSSSVAFTPASHNYYHRTIPKPSNPPAHHAMAKSSSSGKRPLGASDEQDSSKKQKVGDGNAVAASSRPTQTHTAGSTMRAVSSVNGRQTETLPTMPKSKSHDHRARAREFLKHKNQVFSTYRSSKKDVPFAVYDSLLRNLEGYVSMTSRVITEVQAECESALKQVTTVSDSLNEQLQEATNLAFTREQQIRDARMTQDRLRQERNDFRSLLYSASEREGKLLKERDTIHAALEKAKVEHAAALQKAATDHQKQMGTWKAEEQARKIGVLKDVASIAGRLGIEGDLVNALTASMSGQARKENGGTRR